MSLLKNVLIVGALALGSACSSVEVSPGFNAAYVGANTRQEEGYARVINNVSVGNDKVKSHFHGLNEISGTDINTYFGRNSLSIEPLNSGVEFLAEARGGSTGLFEGQPQYGLRDNHVPKLLGADYGFLQATTNGGDSNFTLLYSKNLGFISPSLSPLSLELFNSFDCRKHGSDSNLTEIIADFAINKNLSLFVRQDTNDLEFHDANYIIGGVLRF